MGEKCPSPFSFLLPFLHRFTFLLSDFLDLELAGTRMSLTTTELIELGETLFFNTSHVIGILPEMVVYGIYTTLFSISTYIMIKQGLNSPSRKLLLALTTLMYTITTLYTAASIANIIQLIQILFFGLPTSSTINLQFPIFNALFLVNYSLTDCVVVWRAWVLCQRDHRIVLFTCVFFLCCAFLSEMSTIGIRIVLFVLPPTSESIIASLSRSIDITQVSNLGLSLITNLIATGTVSFKAWRLRKMFYPGPHQPKTGKILVLIVESGVLYSISLITVLVATLIPLTKGTLGDLYTPVNLQLAGIYPLIVLIMVNKNRTLDKAVIAFSDNRTDHAMGSFTTFLNPEWSESGTVVSFTPGRSFPRE
ncbi:hypothetical protein J3R30DRAFT_3580141 [Lentinula aciculospora]|uniref:G protein-coupled receptor n=1 Tax=Lentinula aciculospora TaxID=153920 RepID=A0A9W8ZUA0_9AGAR|nr:hypothetical protein J3R30DRAFT_3580141 [Lentinula aciculospora]